LRPCLGHLHLVQRASGNRDGGAGPFWDTGHDWVSDEQGSDELFWNDLRIAGGQRPLTLAQTTAARASAAAWCTGPLSPRAFIRPDFHIHSLDGVGVDWPISYEELKPVLRATRA
jgi:hypothetical protein